MTPTFWVSSSPQGLCFSTQPVLSFWKGTAAAGNNLGPKNFPGNYLEPNLFGNSLDPNILVLSTTTTVKALAEVILTAAPR